MELLRAMEKPVQLQAETGEAQRLNKILQKCLAKNRMERFASVGEMQQELIKAIRVYPASTTPQTLQ